jgi:hypothetical protein
MRCKYPWKLMAPTLGKFIRGGPTLKRIWRTLLYSEARRNDEDRAHSTPAKEKEHGQQLHALFVERRDDTSRKLLAIAKAATNTPSTMIENPHKQLPETPAIHLSAFVLNPENVTHAISVDETRHILEFVDRHGNSASLRAQFGQYRAQECCFAPSAPAWLVKSVAVEFWTEIYQNSRHSALTWHDQPNEGKPQT